MSLLVLGINHLSAPIAVREQLAINERDLPQALASLIADPVVSECAIVSTCNRTEAYIAVSPGADDPEDALAVWLSGWHGLSRHEFDGRLYGFRDGAAAHHLFSVTAGLDSMILGEPDIQRQVKTALELAQKAHTVGTLLNRLFQEALVTGKKVRTETGIARGSFSIGAAAVDYAAQVFGDSLAGRSVLVLGAGKMSEVTARHLQTRGAPTILVANRTFEKAQQLAAQFGGQAQRFDDLPKLMTQADIMVCSTAAPHPVITYAMVRDVMRARRGRSLAIFDIAVPRDVEASVDDLENVYLANIDHLQAFVSSARQTRALETAHAREIIDLSVSGYLRWWRTLETAPLIVAVREQLESVRLSESARLRARLSHLSEKEWRVIEAAMQAMTNKIAHTAIQAIKEGAQQDAAPAALDAIRHAFGLDQEPQRPGEDRERLPAAQESFS